MASKAGKLNRLSILLVEDDTLFITLVRDVLSMLGFRDVSVALDGKQALDALRKRPRDLVVLDWRLPHMDGIAFSHFLRTNPESPSRYVPIVMLTGKAEQVDVECARDAGVNEFLVKPFRAEDLWQRICQVIENPRPFILAPSFKGPDRRRKIDEIPGGAERRVQQVRMEDPFAAVAG